MTRRSMWHWWRRAVHWYNGKGQSAMAKEMFKGFGGKAYISKIAFDFHDEIETIGIPTVR